MSALLSIEQLTVQFGRPGSEVVAVDQLDLQLQRGETLALVGESGSGKSTVALAIPRLLGEAATIRAGRVLLDGHDLLRLDRKAMTAIRGRHIGMVFQEPMSSLHPMQTVGAQIAEGLRLHLRLGRRTARERAIELLAEVGLPLPRRQVDHYPHQLSGGQRQRVMIAQAIASEPMLLIADEPTTALDPLTQRQVLELLRTLQCRLGSGLLLVSHDLALVDAVSDRVLVMRQGREVESGRTEAVLHAPRAPYTRGLLAARPRPRSECDRLPLLDGVIDGKSVVAAAAASTGEPAAKAARVERPLLEVQGLVVHHRPLRAWFAPRQPRPAVDGVSLQIGHGRTLGLLGESGSGKTTLGRALLRLIEPSAGRVLLDGHDLLAADAAELRRLRKRVQIVFQDPAASLNPSMTLQQTLCEPLALHGIGAGAAERCERAAALLHRVGLDPGWLGRLPHQLSGGQRQRVGIARALAVEPALIVCDEAVSALDLSVQAQILNLLRDLQDERGIGYLFITHDVDVVRFMADDIAVMQAGRLVEQGPAEQVCRAPAHAYTRALLAAVG